MRQYIGRVPTSHRDVIAEIYLSEQIRCTECQKTVPIGIEVVAVQKGVEAEKGPQADLVLPGTCRRLRIAGARRGLGSVDGH